MDAAEQLVALQGDEGASSRAITMAAGQRHNSAISYHFGSRQGLMQAVWTRGTAQVNRRRDELLAEKDNFTLTDLVQIYIRPFTVHMDSQNPSYWARFNEDALRHYPLDIVPHLKKTVEGYNEDIPLGTLVGVFERIQQQTCHGRQPESAMRVSLVVRMVITTLAAWERDHEKATLALTASDLGEELIDRALDLLKGTSSHTPNQIQKTVLAAH